MQSFSRLVSGNAPAIVSVISKTPVNALRSTVCHATCATAKRVLARGDGPTELTTADSRFAAPKHKLFSFSCLHKVLIPQIHYKADVDATRIFTSKINLMQLSTNYEQGLSFHYEKAEQVPQQCLFATKFLESQCQSLFDAHGLRIVKTYKFIPLDSWNDTRIFEIFNNNATELIGSKAAWYIHSFGCGNNQLVDANFRRIKQGLSLQLGKYSERCSLDTLKDAYSQVYSSMRAGWVESNPEEYRDIWFKEDAKKFALFVKKSNLIQEDTLIRFLISKFGLEDQIKCYSKQLEEYYYSSDKIYMWIDKEKRLKIIEKFGFKI